MAELIFWIIGGLAGLGFLLFGLAQEEELYVSQESIRRWENGGKHL